MPKKEKKTWQKVLKYSSEKANRRTVARYYRIWRKEHEFPDRCDNSNCCFHAERLQWNGKILPLILDHKDGNNRDNRPEKLRFLCPNCDSQLDTRGGKNRGRVQEHRPDGFILLNRDRTRLIELFIEEQQTASDGIDAEAK